MRIIQSSVDDGAAKGIQMPTSKSIVAALSAAISGMERIKVLEETLLRLRADIEPLAAQIICPKENTFSRQLALIDAALLKAGPLGAGIEVKA